MNKIYKIEIRNKKQEVKNSVFCLLLLIYCFFSTTTQAQDTIKKPKIGLVLSGGGAKGFAHIGVLKEIEKAGIKIDYIGGASMGAVIGGLYACGYSANQLDSIFRGTNFDELIQDFVPRNNKTFYEKQNDEMYALVLPFQKFKITVPKGLSKGLYNYNLITKLTHKYRHTRDFNKLKIPFICIATNVETGKEEILNNGSLPLALLASSAFPSLFSPVEIDGKVYVDGGVANNYPVEEVRRMGADIIIGVDVQDDLKDRNQLNGAAGVLVQISNFQMIEKMIEKRKLTDIYLKPSIDGFSIISFDQGAAIIKKGQEEALFYEDKLARLGTKFVYSQEKTNKADSLFIKNITIKGIENYTSSYIIGKLRFKQGTKISYLDLDSGINNLNATQNFSAIKYQLVNDNQEETLVLEVTENPIKTLLKFGIHYDDLFKTNALVNLTHKKALFKNDLASLDIILGDNFRYNFDYYRDNGFYWSFGFKSKLNQFEKNSKIDFNNNLYINSLNKESIAIKYLDFSNQAYVQTIFAQKFLIGGGLEHKYITINSNDIGVFDPFIDKSHYLTTFGFLKYDSFSNKYFPKKGWYFFGDFQGYILSSDYKNNFNKFTSFKADTGIVQTVLKKYTLKLQTEGGFIIGEKVNNTFDYVLGGYGFAKLNNFKPFYGYNFLDLSGNSFVKASISLDYEFIKKNHINLTANFANIGDNIFDKSNWISLPRYSGYALGYAIETLIGPIEIKQSWSPETKKNYTWFTVGFWF